VAVRHTKCTQLKFFSSLLSSTCPVLRNKIYVRAALGSWRISRDSCSGWAYPGAMVGFEARRKNDRTCTGPRPDNPTKYAAAYRAMSEEFKGGGIKSGSPAGLSWKAKRKSASISAAASIIASDASNLLLLGCPCVAVANKNVGGG